MTIQDYKSSGVDVQAGDELVEWIKRQPVAGKSKNIIGGVGGFAALYKLDISKYKKPLLVSCTDGVGTKVKIATQLNKYFSTGIDLVAMCVNDLICCGADPLFFLDYYASGNLNLESAQEFLAGVMEGLKQSQCSLIGGETAEMPGHYAKGDYDCAGFCVGIVDQKKVIDGKDIKVGDVAIGIASSGFHSNGYSLLRKLFEKDFSDFGEILLTPTRIYVPLIDSLKKKIQIKAMAHITGGGILGNASRTLPKGKAVKLGRWPWPDIFLEAQRRSQMSPTQMLETFNCGIGFVVYVSKKDSSKVISESAKLGWQAQPIGSVVAHKGEAEVLV